MSRISRHQAFMMCAEVWSQRSTCMRRNVGAVIVYDRHIISHGYNGPPAGEPHCLGVNCVPPGTVGCIRALHAEANALDHMPLGFFGLHMYTTESPCLACATRITQSGIRTLFYRHLYRDPTGLNHLIDAKIRIFCLTPSGYIIDHLTNELLEEI